MQIHHLIHVCLSYFVLVQPEAGVWEAGQREDGDAEALHHGESNQVFTRAVRWFVALTGPLRISLKTLIGSYTGITTTGVVSMLLAGLMLSSLYVIQE